MAGPIFRTALSLAAILFFGTPTYFCQALEQPSRFFSLKWVNNVSQLIESGNFEQAENELNQRIKNEPDRFAAYYLLGFLELRRGRTFSSTRAFRRAQELEPDNAEVACRLATNYFLLNQRTLFRNQVQKAISADENNAEAHFLSGRFAYEVENDFHQAVEHLRKAVELKSDDVRAQYYLGLSYQALQQREEAEQRLLNACTVAASANMAYDAPFRSLAELYIEKGETDRALHYSAQALRISSGAENYYVLGKAEYRAGRFEAAADALERAARLDPSYAQPHYLLGSVYSKLGRKALARREFDLFKKLRDRYGE